MHEGESVGSGQLGILRAWVRRWGLSPPHILQWSSAWLWGPSQGERVRVQQLVGGGGLCHMVGILGEAKREGVGLDAWTTQALAAEPGDGDSGPRREGGAGVTQAVRSHTFPP